MDCVYTFDKENQRVLWFLLQQRLAYIHIHIESKEMGCIEGNMYLYRRPLKKTKEWSHEYVNHQLSTIVSEDKNRLLWLTYYFIYALTLSAICRAHNLVRTSQQCMCTVHPFWSLLVPYIRECHYRKQHRWFNCHSVWFQVSNHTLYINTISIVWLISAYSLFSAWHHIC